MRKFILVLKTKTSATSREYVVTLRFISVRENCFHGPVTNLFLETGYEICF